MSSQRSFSYISLIAILVLNIGACSFLEPHKLVIQQGSWIDEKKVDQLTIGMNKDQVTYLLGSALINDTLYPNRWIYRFSKTQDGQKLSLKRLQLDFNGDTLAHITTFEEIEKTDDDTKSDSSPNNNPNNKDIDSTNSESNQTTISEEE